MKIKKSLMSILLTGTVALAGCDNTEYSNLEKEYSNETTFITTAEYVKIKPHYGSDPILMDGITVTRFAYGDGLSLPNIKESKKYIKGSPEYRILRPMLTVKRLK